MIETFFNNLALERVIVRDAFDDLVEGSGNDFGGLGLVADGEGGGFAVASDVVGGDLDKEVSGLGIGTATDGEGDFFMNSNRVIGDFH